MNAAYHWLNTTENEIIYNPDTTVQNTYIGSAEQQATSVVTDTNQNCYEGEAGCYSIYGFEVRLLSMFHLGLHDADRCLVSARYIYYYVVRGPLLIASSLLTFRLRKCVHNMDSQQPDCLDAQCSWHGCRYCHSNFSAPNITRTYGTCALCLVLVYI